jgi:hypothetical protein
MKRSILLLGFLVLTAACQPATATLPPAPLFPTATLTASPVPVTDTPGPTATPEPSATPFPQFFTNEFDASLAGWVILQAGNDAVPNITTENSRLLLQMDAPYTWVYALYGAQDYGSVRVATKFVNNALSPASVGLICRYSETDGWLEYNVSTDGTYNVLYGKWLANGIADYRPILSGSSNEIVQSGAEQLIGLACSDGTMSLYINEKLIRNVDVSRYELPSGKVGMTASSYENASDRIVRLGGDQRTIVLPHPNTTDELQSYLGEAGRGEGAPIQFLHDVNSFLALGR